jgi:hypothetical protein
VYDRRKECCSRSECVYKKMTDHLFGSVVNNRMLRLCIIPPRL